MNCYNIFARGNNLFFLVPFKGTVSVISRDLPFIEWHVRLERYPLKLCLIKDFVYILIHSGCPKKHGNSVTNSISSLLWISIVIPNFKSHSIIMSARVYLMKTVKDCKDVSIMSPQNEHWRRTSLLLFYKVQPYAVKT